MIVDDKANLKMPQVSKLEPTEIIVKQQDFANLKSEYLVAYSKLVYRVGFMMITFSFENDEVNGLPYFVPTIDRSKLKRNSRASYFKVEETDVGQEGG